MFGMGPAEMVLVGIVAVLLFGSRLPEVARSLGGSYRQFRAGLSDLQSQVQYDAPSTPEATSYLSSSEDNDEDDYADAAAPKFEPPPADEDQTA